MFKRAFVCLNIFSYKYCMCIYCIWVLCIDWSGVSIEPPSVGRFTCCASPSCLKLASVAPSARQAASASLKFILYLPSGERSWKTPAVLAEPQQPLLGVFFGCIEIQFWVCTGHFILCLWWLTWLLSKIHEACIVRRAVSETCHSVPGKITNIV